MKVIKTMFWSHGQNHIAKKVKFRQKSEFPKERRSQTTKKKTQILILCVFVVHMETAKSCCGLASTIKCAFFLCSCCRCCHCATVVATVCLWGEVKRSTLLHCNWWAITAIATFWSIRQATIGASKVSNTSPSSCCYLPFGLLLRFKRNKSNKFGISKKKCNRVIQSVRYALGVQQ